MQVQITFPSLPMHVQSYHLADYEVLTVQALRLVLLFRENRPLYYLPLSPAEYHLFLSLLQAQPIGASHSFPRNETNTRQALERHMSRLKRKLPATWRIRYRQQTGYHLQIASSVPVLQPPGMTRPWHDSPSLGEHNHLLSSAPPRCR